MATTINKKYTITMTLSDGNTATADFTIPVACPTAAEVKCATDWYDTETKEANWQRQETTIETESGWVTQYCASVTIVFEHNIEDEALIKGATGYPKFATKTISGNRLTYSVPVSTTWVGATSGTARATLSYKMDNMSTVDDRLAYLYTHHA